MQRTQALDISKVVEYEHHMGNLPVQTSEAQHGILDAIPRARKRQKIEKVRLSTLPKSTQRIKKKVQTVLEPPAPFSLNGDVSVTASVLPSEPVGDDIAYTSDSEMYVLHGRVLFSVDLE